MGIDEAPPEQETVPACDWRAGLLAKSLICLLFVCGFVAGGYVAGTAFHDPDTCWLLAIGQKIAEQMKLPEVDPFSYIGAEGKYVVYQWLTELLFYGAYKIAGGLSLMIFVGMVLITAFFVIPVNLIADTRKAPIACFAAVILTFVASSYHILARPEIFSYLLLSCTLSLLLRHRLKLGVKQELGHLKWQLPLIFVFWANLHTGFTSGLIALAFFGLALISEHFFGKTKIISLVYIRNYVFLFFGCLGATMVNPYGFGLWQYIYHLFFSPFNPHIMELGPLTPDRLKEFTFYPFLSLSVLALFLIARTLRPSRYPISGLYSLYVAIYVIASGFSCRRLIMFANICLLYEVMFLLQAGKISNQASEAIADSIDSPGGNKLLGVQVSQSFGELLAEKAWVAIFIVMSGLGVFLISSRVIPPEIPQSSTGFVMPTKAIEYLGKNVPQGKLYSDAQYGDAIIWHLAAKGVPIKVFVDTRFDMYGDELMKDYYRLRNCQKGWRKLIDKYDFGYIFLPREGSLTDKLIESEDWDVVFKDKVSVIFKRRKAS